MFELHKKVMCVMLPMPSPSTINPILINRLDLQYWDPEQTQRTETEVQLATKASLSFFPNTLLELIAESQYNLILISPS